MVPSTLALSFVSSCCARDRVVGLDPALNALTSLKTGLGAVIFYNYHHRPSWDGYQRRMVAVVDLIGYYDKVINFSIAFITNLLLSTMRLPTQDCIPRRSFILRFCGSMARHEVFFLSSPGPLALSLSPKFPILLEHAHSTWMASAYGLLVKVYPALDFGLPDQSEVGLRWSSQPPGRRNQRRLMLCRHARSRRGQPHFGHLAAASSEWRAGSPSGWITRVVFLTSRAARASACALEHRRTAYIPPDDRCRCNVDRGRQSVMASRR